MFVGNIPSTSVFVEVRKNVRPLCPVLSQYKCAYIIGRPRSFGIRTQYLILPRPHILFTYTYSTLRIGANKKEIADIPNRENKIKTENKKVQKLHQIRSKITLCHKNHELNYTIKSQIYRSRKNHCLKRYIWWRTNAFVRWSSILRILSHYPISIEIDYPELGSIFYIKVSSSIRA